MGSRKKDGFQHDLQFNKGRIPGQSVPVVSPSDPHAMAERKKSQVAPNDFSGGREVPRGAADDPAARRRDRASQDAPILEGLLRAKGASRQRNATRHMACIRPCEKGQSQGQVRLKHKRQTAKAKRSTLAGSSLGTAF